MCFFFNLFMLMVVFFNYSFTFHFVLNKTLCFLKILLFFTFMQTIQNPTLSGFKCQYCNRYQQCPSGTTTVSSLGQVCPSNPTLQSERNVKKPTMILDPNTGRDLTSEILNVREGRYEIPITSPKPNGHGSKTIKTIDTVKNEQYNQCLYCFIFIL